MCKVSYSCSLMSCVNLDLGWICTVITWVNLDLRWRHNAIFRGTIIICLWMADIRDFNSYTCRVDWHRNHQSTKENSNCLHSESVSGHWQQGVKMLSEIQSEKFKKSASYIMKEMRYLEEFCDITLVSEGRERIQAHRVVIASASTTSRDIFQSEEENSEYQVIQN